MAKIMLPALLLALAIGQAGFPGKASALDLLRIQIRTVLPQDIQSIGEAAQYFANAAGYRLTTSDPAPAESAAIAAEPITPLFASGKVKPVDEAILELLRPGCVLVIDREHKLFSFEKGESK
jgi:type IV pili sensor histidine kinase/response regulator